MQETQHSNLQGRLSGTKISKQKGFQNKCICHNLWWLDSHLIPFSQQWYFYYIPWFHSLSALIFIHALKAIKALVTNEEMKTSMRRSSSSMKGWVQPNKWRVLHVTGRYALPKSESKPTILMWGKSHTIRHELVTDTHDLLHSNSFTTICMACYSLISSQNIYQLVKHSK